MWPVLRRRRLKEQDLDEELEAHLALEIKQRVDEGDAPDDAARGARRSLGSVPFLKDATRDTWRGAWLDALAQDLRYALRMMRRAPAFTLIALLTLGLGIGANSAIFSIVDKALLRPLPFPDPDRLVRIRATRNGVPFAGPSALDTRDLAAASPSFEGLIAYDQWRKNVSLGETHESAETVVGLVPGEYFRLLRIEPLLGRLFTDDESVYGQHYVAAISESLWRTRLAADPHVLGKTLRINGESYTIVAVMPDAIPAWVEHWSVPQFIWTPFVSPDMWNERSRGARDDSSIGRLKPGVSYEQARAELSAAAARLAHDHPIDRGIGVDMQPLADDRAGPAKPLLLMLVGAVSLVLLIACANLAGLLVARNAARSRELAVRTALGAGRARLLRQLLLETLVLAGAGGLAGLGIAWAAGLVLAANHSAQPLEYAIASKALRQFWSTGLDVRVLAFTFAVSIVTALLFGLIPAFTSTRGALADALKDGGRTGTAGLRKQRVRRLLVITEVGLSLMLVFAAALLTQTIIRLDQQDPGFRADHLLLGHIYVPPARYPDPDAITRFCEAAGDRIRALPGVVGATVTTSVPPVLGWQQTFTIPGVPVSRPDDVPITRFGAVDAQYLDTLGFTLLRGRQFASSDTAGGVPVAIVNEEFARRFFPHQDPIGRDIQPGPPDGIPSTPLQDFGGSHRPITIVGVIRNFMNDGPAHPPAPQLFMLFRQIPGLNFGFKDLIIRTSIEPTRLAPAVAAALQAIDPEIPLGEVRTMETHIAGQTADTRFATVVLGLFAALGIVLAVIGAYGVVSYLVAQRTQEMGVRLALGATARGMLWLVLRDGLSLGVAGVTVGVLGAMAVRQLLTGLLHGVAVSDPLTLAGAAALLLGVIAAACAVPARRAMRINPVQALRGE